MKEAHGDRKSPKGRIGLNAMPIGNGLTPSIDACQDFSPSYTKPAAPPGYLGEGYRPAELTRLRYSQVKSFMRYQLTYLCAM